ncbi:MAG: hypothetical protein RXR41_01195 [Candidatus Marsarchaeota archaeon]
MEAKTGQGSAGVTGGGEFMLFVVPPDKRAEVMKAPSDYRVEEVKVDPFGVEGARRPERDEKHSNRNPESKS